MRIYSVALKEVAKRKVRTLYTALGIAIAVSMLVSVLITASSGQSEVFRVIARYGHSLSIVPVENTAQSLRNFGIATGSYIPEDSVGEIEAVYQDAITAGWERIGGLVLGQGTMGAGGTGLAKPTFAPRLYESATVRGKDVIVGGVDLERELVARFWWDTAEGEFMRSDGEAVVGRLLADLTATKVGDVIDVAGRPVRVTGILKETDSPDDYMVFMGLRAVQAIFGKQGRISMINVRAMCPKCPVGEAAIEINKKVIGVRATSQMEIATAQSHIFEKTTTLILAFVLAALVISCIGVFNIIMGAIHARMREIGLLKILGASTGQLTRLFLYEAVFIGCTGGLLGFALGAGLAHLIGPILFSDIVIQVSPRFLGISLALAVTTTVTASIYPARYASRIRVADAFKAL